GRAYASSRRLAAAPGRGGTRSAPRWRRRASDCSARPTRTRTPGSTWPWSRRAASARSAPRWGGGRLTRPAGGARAGVGAVCERMVVTAGGAESLTEPGAWDLVRVRPGDVVYVSGYGLVPPGSGQ